ncbi:MAG: LysM peptidoglycan-binding domain-containing protein [Bacteroidales bacterium]|nr:LysM peptidoglycan-binding domain-containing protein [Bacteroidales bacterium]
MKAFKVYALVLILVLFSSLPVIAQEDRVEVERSDEKVMIGGEVYYVHVVKKGQTLYSISKAYNVGQKEIARENPDILMGLRTGQALKIPFRPEKEEETKAKDTTQYYYHEVKAGETLFSLSRRYQVSEEVIKKYNPVLYEEELQARQVYRIPKQPELAEEDSTRAKTVSGEDYILHEVKKKETLYSLSKQYGLEIRDIIQANEKLQDEELQYGSVIKIPKKEEKEEELLTTGEDQMAYDTVPSHYQAMREYAPTCDSSDYFKNNVVEVGVFLPFFLEENAEQFYIDSSKTNDEGEKIYKKVQRDPFYIYPRSQNFIRFYEGMLVALDSLSNKGVSVRLKVFDTADDPDKVKQILSDNSLENLDLIIGPVYQECFSVMADFAKENQIHIVSPFSRENKILADNPYVIQIRPSREAQLDQFVSYISSYSDNNMIMVHSGDSLYYPRIRRYKQRLFNRMSQDTSFGDVRFKEVAFKDSMFYLEQAMNKGEENIIMVPSEDEAFVTDVVTNLNTLAKKGYDMRVFGYSNWQDFVNIELEYFYNINLSLYTSFHVNYQDDLINPVIRNYRAMFSSEPGSYAFHGFDIGYYFLNAMYRFGRDFEKCLPYYDISLCHSNYKFYRPYRRSGLENVSLNILRYRDDLTIQTIDLNKTFNSALKTE